MDQKEKEKQNGFFWAENNNWFIILYETLEFYNKRD